VVDDCRGAAARTAAWAEPQGSVGADPRTVALRAAVTRVRGELAGYRVELPDRAMAEEALAAMAGAAEAGAVETERLRHSLLLVAAALGSVSALAAGLAELCRAVDLFGRDGTPDPARD
jgi:hypothetical protein